jgi:hypothetical protein
MFTKFYDRLDLSRAHLDDVLTAPANRAKALDVARELNLPRQSLTRATTRLGFWVYVFQLGADVQLGTVTLAGTQPGPQNVVTLPVRQLDRAGWPAGRGRRGLPTHHPDRAAGRQPHQGPRPVGRRPPHRPAHIDIRDLDRAFTSKFAPAIRAWRTGDAFPPPRLADTAWPEPLPNPR